MGWKVKGFAPGSCAPIMGLIGGASGACQIRGFCSRGTCNGGQWEIIGGPQIFKFLLFGQLP